MNHNTSTTLDWLRRSRRLLKIKLALEHLGMSGGGAGPRWSFDPRAGALPPRRAPVHNCDLNSRHGGAVSRHLLTDKRKHWTRHYRGARRTTCAISMSPRDPNPNILEAFSNETCSGLCISYVSIFFVSRIVSMRILCGLEVMSVARWRRFGCCELIRVS